MPMGNPSSLLTLSVTEERKPPSGVMVTGYVADPPGTTGLEAGVTEIWKSAAAGRTVMSRVAGVGSVLFAASMTVSEARYFPAVANVTFPMVPGTLFDETAGDPPGKIHVYLDAVVDVLKKTEPPALIVTSEAGALIVP